VNPILRAKIKKSQNYFRLLLIPLDFFTVLRLFFGAALPRFGVP